MTPDTAGRRPETPAAGDWASALDLADLVRSLWRARWWFAIAVLLCAMAGAGLAVAQGRWYEAVVMMAVATPKTGEADAPGQVTPANFRPVVANKSVVARVIEAFHLRDQGLTADAFMRRALSVNEIRESNLIRLAVTLRDPATAAEVANRIAQEAIALSRRLSQEELVRSRDEIREQLQQVERRLVEAEQKVVAFRREAQIELLRKDVETLLNQRAELMRTRVELAGVQARVETGERELAARHRIDELRREITDDPALAEVVRQSGVNAAGVVTLSSSSQWVNSVYQGLDAKLADDRTRASQLDRQVSQLTRTSDLAGERLAKLDVLYAREEELARLELERDLAKRVYEEVARQHEIARLRIAQRSAQLQVLDPAVPPSEPLARGTVVAALLGAVLGVVATAFVLLGRAVVSSSRT